MCGVAASASFPDCGFGDNTSAQVGRQMTTPFGTFSIPFDCVVFGISRKTALGFSCPACAGTVAGRGREIALSNPRRRIWQSRRVRDKGANKKSAAIPKFGRSVIAEHFGLHYGLKAMQSISIFICLLANFASTVVRAGLAAPKNSAQTAFMAEKSSPSRRMVTAGKDWEVLRVNDLDEECYATPAIVDGDLDVRAGRNLYRFKRLLGELQLCAFCNSNSKPFEILITIFDGFNMSTNGPISGSQEEHWLPAFHRKWHKAAVVL